MNEVIFNEKAPAPIGPYSQGRRVGNTWYFSGQIALDADSGTMVGEGDVEAQTRQVMKNIQILLDHCGLTWGDVAKTSIFLKDMNDFPAVNAVYAHAFPEGSAFPARETVEVARLPKDALVEISVIAAK
ncbi:MAG: Rid family detoxifying hydrolase [Bacteroidia bacterium]